MISLCRFPWFAIDDAAPAGGQVHAAEDARVADQVGDAAVTMGVIVDAQPAPAAIERAVNALATVDASGHVQRGCLLAGRRFAETKGIDAGDAGRSGEDLA